MKIYVSSTFEDLKEFRREVYQQLRKLRIDAVAMEDYVASERRPLAICLEDVAASDIYVGIFAWRYGYIPKEEGNPESRSITELEYNTAGQLSKERLIFLLRDDAPWQPSLMDTHTGAGNNGKQIARLREELGTRHAVGFFSSPDELAKEVSTAVTNILLRKLGEVKVGDARGQADGAQPSLTTSVHANRDGLYLTWAAYLHGGEAARNVGRIENAAGSAVASGFLVSGVNLHPRLGSDLYLLTPAHIIVPEKTQGSFGLTVDEARFRLTTADDAQQPIRLAEIAWFSPINELDLSIVRLEHQPMGVSGLAIARRLPVLDGNPVILIGHPRGGALTFSLGGVLLDHDDRRLQYVVQTEPGSGGSPVLNTKWEAIGVHRVRGTLPPLSGQGQPRDVCEAFSLPAIQQALRAHFG
jgi:hypothetical protein